jgi:hypothetical protein
MCDKNFSPLRQEKVWKISLTIYRQLLWNTLYTLIPTITSIEISSLSHPLFLLFFLSLICSFWINFSSCKACISASLFPFLAYLVPLLFFTSLLFFPFMRVCLDLLCLLYSSYCSLITHTRWTNSGYSNIGCIF